MNNLSEREIYGITHDNKNFRDMNKIKFTDQSTINKDFKLNPVFKYTKNKKKLLFGNDDVEKMINNIGIYKKNEDKDEKDANKHPYADYLQNSSNIGKKYVEQYSSSNKYVKDVIDNLFEKDKNINDTDNIIDYRYKKFNVSDIYDNNSIIKKKKELKMKRNNAKKLINNLSLIKK